MTAYKLVTTTADGDQTTQVIDPRYLLVVSASPGVDYRLVAVETDAEPENQRLHRREGDLLIEGDGEALVRIIDFFDADLSVSYTASESAVITGDLVASEASADGVVWSAVEGGGGVCLFAAAVVAAGAAASSSSSASSGAGAGGGGAGAGAGAAGAGAAGASGGMMASIASAVASNVAVAAAAAAAAAAATAAAIAEDDPDLGVLNIVPVAGPFTGFANIALYAEDGELLLSEVVEHNFAEQAFKFTLPEGYRGPVLVVISEVNDSEPDFVDEATGEARNMGGDLRAILDITDASVREVSITPLTELAVRLADIEEGAPLSAGDLLANTRIGEIFGVEDITAAVTDIFNASYNEADGLSEAEQYGQVLAAISGVATGSDLNYAIDQMQSYLQGSAENLEVDQELFVVLREAAEFFESGVNAELAAIAAVTSPVAPRLAPAQLPQLANSSVVNRAFLDEGVTIEIDLSSEAIAGSEVALYWGEQRLDYTLTSADIAAATISLVVEGSLIEPQGNGAIEVVVAFDGVLRPLTIVIEVDVEEPVLVPLDASYPELRSAESALGIVSQQSGSVQTIVSWVFVDSNEAVSTDGLMQIDSNGQLSLTSAGLASAANDYETTPNTYNYQVKAQDANANWSAPAQVSFSVTDVNEAPTGVALTSTVASLAEDADTTSRTKIADIAITDDALGTNTISLTGDDAALFEVVGSELFLKAGTSLDFEDADANSFAVTVSVIDSGLTGSTAVTVDHTLSIADVNEAPTGVALTSAVATLAEDADTSSRTKIADIAITDDALGTNTISLTGDDAALFEVVGSELFLKAGTSLDYETASSLAVTVSVNDSSLTGSTAVTVDHTLNITDVNEAPTGVALTSAVANLAEDADTTSRTKIADIAITDDALGTNTISLTGDDAALFEVVGSELFLKAGTSLDYETASSLAVTVSVIDSSLGSDAVTVDHTLNITDVNEAPTGVALTSAVASLAEDADTSSRTKIADIAITDDALGTNTISLTGDDAALFEVVGSELFLKAGTSLDYETASSLAVTVSVIDSSLTGSTAVTVDHTLSIVDVNEAPTGVALTSAVASLAEDADTSLRTKIADIAITDDALGTNTISLTGADAALFEVVGSELFLKAGTSLDYETANSLAVTVSVIDSSLTGSTAVTVDHTLNITDVNEAPTGVALTSAVASLAEDADTSSRTKIADIAITDDALGTNTISLTGADAALFEVVGSELFLKAGTSLDYETASSLAVTVSVNDSSLGSDAVTVDHTLNITDVNEAPTGVALTSAVATLAEDADTTSRTKIADIAITDDALGTNTISLTGDDAALFEVVGSELFLKAGTSLDYETANSLAVTVSVIDTSITGSTAVTVDHTLSITDVNEAPTGVGLDNTVSSVPLNLDNSVRTKLADIVITDDALGLNSVELGGADADLFEVEGSALYLSAGVIFDIDTKPQYNLTVTVQDEAFSSAVSTDFTLSVDPPEVFFNLSASSYPFAGGSVASGQSTSYGDSRTFDADLTYDIFIVIDGATNSLAALPSNHMWSGADNLGSDDQITLISKDGTGISVTAGRNDFANGLDARPNGSALTLTRQTDIRRSSYTQNIRLESDGQFYMYVRHWDGDLDYHSRGGWGYVPAQYPVDLWNGNFSVGSAPGFSLSARALWSDFVLVG